MRTWSILVSVVAAVLASTPYVLKFAGLQVSEYLLIPTNFVAWVCVALLFVSHRRMLEAVDRAFHEIGFERMRGSLERKLASFLRESARYYRAQYSFEVGQGDRVADLGANLRRIVKLAYQELGAQSVELALYDESTHQWSQAFIMGMPTTVLSQSMMGDAGLTRLSADDDPRTLQQPVNFAGTNFGVLRIEFPEDVVPTASDRKVARLLATQGALLLIDARFTEELLKLRRKSEESTRAKTGFLANLSHEIRGPLSVILNATELMLDNLCGPLSPQQLETCTMIRKSGEHLLDLVNDVLDYAKVEAGKVTTTPVPVSVRDLVSDLANVVRSQTISKKQALMVEDVDRSLAMLCDKRHARQMVINFLTNAVKYTPDGGKVTIGAQRISSDRVKLFVKDTGVGIPDHERGKVFAAFERVNNPYALAQSGTGLGMPLTKRLAEVNGGTADFESIEGEGSTFWIILPTADIAAAQAMAAAEVHDDGTKHGRGETVLLVDEDSEARTMLERYLVHQGFRVIALSSAPQVIKALKDEVVQLAVIENDLVQIGGEEMISIIRGHPRAASIPIILLSAKAFVFDIERFLRLGVDRCLSKPVPLGEIALTARKLLDESKLLSSGIVRH